MNYEVIIGIEMHVELLTKTKMFSDGLIEFAAKPNSIVSANDCALPGTMPTVNRHAVELALRACMGLNMTIDPLLRFDRKNYYYSDLPKGYQITQQFYPIGSAGTIELDSGKKVAIERLHIEEDTAKQEHHGDYTFIDYNRAGNPLIEIVSEPDMNSAEEAVEYVKKVSQTLEYLNVSNVIMAEGSMRCDINISLRPIGYKEFGNKVEIKNMNSLNNIERAINYEIKRQADRLNKGYQIIEETRRFNEADNTTVTMRAKDDTVDYRYMPEPNIYPILLEDDYIQDVRNNLPELAAEKAERYKALNLKEYDIQVIVENKELSEFFDQLIQETDHSEIAANWTISEVMAVLNREQLSASQLELDPKELAIMINMIQDRKISGKQAKTVFNEIIQGKKTEAVVKEKGLEVISDEASILEFIHQAIEANPQAIDDFRDGKDRAIGFLVGQVMRLSQGKVDPQLTNQLIKKELESMI